MEPCMEPAISLAPMEQKMASITKSPTGGYRVQWRIWGAWAADRKHLGVSVLYKMMRKYGDVERRLGNTARNEVDLMDALLVNRAWQGLPNSPLRYKTTKWILVAHYAYPTMLPKLPIK